MKGSFDGNSMKVAELLVKNGFKEAYAIKGGVRGEKGWLVCSVLFILSNSFPSILVFYPLCRFYWEFVYSDMSNGSRVLPEGPNENGELLLDLASSQFSCYSFPLLADVGVISRSLLFLEK